MNVKELAKAMQEIDFCMMTTIDGRGTFHSRPMSNNKQVEYDGSSYFFSMRDTQKIRDIDSSPRTSLTYQGQKGLFIQIYGDAMIIHDKQKMEDFWLEELNAWFKNGLNTEGLVMIHVKGKWVEYWQKENNEIIDLTK